MTENLIALLRGSTAVYLTRRQRQDIASALEALSEWQTAYRELASRARELDAEYVALRDTERAKAATIDSLRSDCDALRGELAATRGERDALRAELAAAPSDLDDLKSELASTVPRPNDDTAPGLSADTALVLPPIPSIDDIIPSHRRQPSRAAGNKYSRAWFQAYQKYTNELRASLLPDHKGEWVVLGAGWDKPMLFSSMVGAFHHVHQQYPSSSKELYVDEIGDELYRNITEDFSPPRVLLDAIPASQCNASDTRPFQYHTNSW